MSEACLSPVARDFFDRWHQHGGTMSADTLNPGEPPLLFLEANCLGADDPVASEMVDEIFAPERLGLYDEILSYVLGSR